MTEALTQLTWGGPQVVYNGGLPQARVRYYDADARRPGLPPAVAALVSSIDPRATVVDLVNLDAIETRRLVVQAGAFAQDSICSVRHTVGAELDWPGSFYDYVHQSVPVTTHSMRCEGPWLGVTMRLRERLVITAVGLDEDQSRDLVPPEMASLGAVDAPQRRLCVRLSMVTRVMVPVVDVRLKDDRTS